MKYGTGNFLVSRVAKSIISQFILLSWWGTSQFLCRSSSLPGSFANHDFASCLPGPAPFLSELATSCRHRWTALDYLCSKHE
jgi:hypothetical protein